MARNSTICPLLIPSMVLLAPTGSLLAQQAPDGNEHAHLGEVACVDVPPGEKRPEFGCFNIGTVTGLRFSQPLVYWHLLRVSAFGR